MSFLETYGRRHARHEADNQAALQQLQNPNLFGLPDAIKASDLTPREFIPRRARVFRSQAMRQRFG